MMTLSFHWLASITAILLCCTALSQGTFRISPWKQDMLLTNEIQPQEVMLSGHNRKFNSSFCKENVGLSKEAEEIFRIFCKETALYPDTEKGLNTFFYSSDSDTLVQESFSSPDLNNVLLKQNRPKKNSFEKSIETSAVSAADEVKSKRQNGNRSGPCRSTPQTYGEHEPLPWTCRQRKEWLSLPDNVYPNRVYSTVCESTSCMNGHFNCTPVTYSLQLLKMCHGGQCDDDRIPYSLRSSWLFQEYPVTIGCSCTR